MLTLLLLLLSLAAHAQWEFSTDYFKIRINNKGYITSMKNTMVKPMREFSPTEKPSPILSLYDSKRKVFYTPAKAEYNKAEELISLTFTNGSTATVSLVSHPKYLELTLISLSQRQDIEAIQWGPVHTNITNLLGEIIGVARDTNH